MIETITAQEFFFTLSAALLVGALSMVFVLRKYLFSNFRDIYPVKKPKDEKNKTRTGPQDIGLDLANKSRDNRPDGPNYDQIIDEFPTYDRQVKK